MSRGLATALRAVATLAGLTLISSAVWTAKTFYFGFALPQAGMRHLLAEELGQQQLYRAFGLPALVLLAWGLAPLVGHVTPALRRIARAGYWVPAIAAGFVFTVGALVAGPVLQGAPVTDDEHVMSFIAETLLAGGVVAPAPAGPEADWAFFKEQFVALGPRGRFGQYSIGQPLALAAGRAFGLEPLVVPAISAGLALALYALCRRLCGPRVAALGVVLFALSPQVLLTAGTRLSQPLSALLLVLGMLALRSAAAERPGRWAVVLAGLALGAAFVVRPLPGALLVTAAAAYLAWLRRDERSAAVRDLVAFAATAAVGVAVVLATNGAQTGHLFVSAYQLAHNVPTDATGLSAIGGRTAALGARVFSLVGNLLRADLWLLGWPLSLLLLGFARRTRNVALPWLFLAAVLAYRLLTPKQGVATTGPVYMYEAVPLLCLLAADGLVRLASVRRLGALVPAGVLAGFVLSATLFLPSRLGDLQQAGAAQRSAAIALAGIPGPLAVFHLGITPAHSTWANFPRPNPADYAARVLYFRFLRTPDGDAAPTLEFARRRFPDRTALFFGWDGERPVLQRLEDYAQRRELRP